MPVKRRLKNFLSNFCLKTVIYFLSFLFTLIILHAFILKPNKFELRNPAVPNSESRETVNETGLKVTTSVNSIYSASIDTNVSILLRPISKQDLTALTTDMEPGGHYSQPAKESPRNNSKVAIILPFRDRTEHLSIFLLNIIPFLKKQRIEFQIFVLEQLDQLPFNRASLFNVGYVEALILDAFSCFIFHDVDHLPKDYRNIYDCDERGPLHMAVAVDKWNYKPPYSGFFGGVVAFTKAQYQQINGFSNCYWGWGAEDDDMSYRTALHGLVIQRRGPEVARYQTISHKPAVANPKRIEVLSKRANRIGMDGLKDVQFQYVILRHEALQLYTFIGVKFDESQREKCEGRLPTTGY